MEVVLESIFELAYIMVNSMFLFLLIALVFYYKNRRAYEEAKMELKGELDSPFELTLSQLGVGILAGFISIIILNLLNINFSEDSKIELIFILSIALMVYKKRFICFSYSGMLLGILSLIIGKYFGETKFLNIAIINIIIFVGVMHIIEAILIVLDGSRGAQPIFNTIDGEIYGGFKLSRYWLSPILGLFGIIGYSSSTYTYNKKKKSLESGILVASYGTIIILLAFLFKEKGVLEILLLILMPILHEFMLSLQLDFEKKREKIFISNEGICVLDVSNKGKAKEIGIESGDIIYKVNDKIPTSEHNFYHLINNYYGRAEVEIKKNDGKIRKYQLKLKQEDRLGLILVPTKEDFEINLKKEQKSFNEILNMTIRK